MVSSLSSYLITKIRLSLLYQDPSGFNVIPYATVHPGTMPCCQVLF
jgi:hypothetical protein